MKLRFSNHFAALMGLVLIAAAGVVAHSAATVVSADGFGLTEITFTKWVTDFPKMEGVVGGDVGDGDFVGTVLDAVPVAGGKIVKISAEYILKGSQHQSTLHLTVWQFGNRFAAINGSVVDGWKKGATVYGRYTVISCGQAPDDTCFQGRLYFAGGAP